MRYPKQPAKFAMLLLLALLLLCNGVGNVHGKTIHENSVDLHALLAFKQGITSDPQGALSNWNTTIHFCRWNGVNCTTTPPFRVSSLKLVGKNLLGRISPSLGNLTFLQTLNLGENRLSGEFPHAILNLSASLQILNLEYNMLGKALPPNIGDRLPRLTNLTLGQNSFEGAIPASLGNALGLRLLDLSSNFLTGKIPTSFGKLSNLTILNLELNYLEARDNRDWEFLNALGNCRSLKTLSLSANELHGSIPQSIGNLSPGLQNLVMAGNKLSGQVPQSIEKLSALNKLALNVNDLNGTIDGWIGKLKSLQLLSLRSNRFTGPIPYSIGNLTSLTYLYMSENEFGGLIPTSLGNLPLRKLDLSSNILQGYIPPNIGFLKDLTVFNLSYNKLQGDILPISNLKQLTILDLSSNSLTGEIPDSLSECNGLVTLQMDQNFLTGNIPISFGNLLSLGMLNLSHNNLSGSIPLTLNKLQSLDNLDLSYNDLQGVIPRNGIFENATAVSLEGNRGLCGGAMDLHMAPCTTVSQKAQRRYRLIKVLIPIFGFMSLILLVYFLLLEKKMRRSTDDTSTSLGENFLKVSYADLAQATANFSESNLVGRGGYGSVYRGKLKESKVEVAVKVFDLEMHGAEKSFLKECEALRSIQHRNLLPILTACSTVDNTGNVFKALVYEFMPNGNLDAWLHHGEEGKAHKHLSFAERLSISANMADALDYLHFDCGRPTIHCDLKPSNILLDDDMNALLGDFGIASLYQDSWSTSTGSMSSSSVGVKGTIGYIAPEYAGGGRCASTSGDVYGFGIILLEMMTGKRPTDPMFKDGVTIVDFVESKFPHEIDHVVDANLGEKCRNIAQAKNATENYVHECLVSVLQLALSCTHPVPSARMNMKEIASKIQAIKTSYVGHKAQECASLELE